MGRWEVCACAMVLSAGCSGGPGDDWRQLGGTPMFVSVLDVWSLSSDDTWVVDGGAVVHRTDGSEWSTLDTPVGGSLSCIFGLSPTDVWLCAGREVVHYDGNAFTAFDVATETGLSSVTAIWASAANDVWAVGDDAIVAHYDGTQWSRTLVPSSFNSSIWGSSPSDIYVLGTFDVIHFDGTDWSEVPFDGGGGDGEVFGTSGSDVWIVTDSSELGHYDGSAWTIVDTFDFVGDLAAVWGPAPDDLWAAGSAGSIAHYDGNSWTEVTHQKIGSPFLRQFLAVHGTASDDVWAVGHQLGEGGATGIIFHYDP